MIESVMNDPTNENKRPWYKEPLVWLVISLPMSAVLAGFYTLYLAIDSYDGLVVDDYYKQGLAINKRLEKQDMAKQYGLETDLQFNHDDGQLRLILTANESFSAPKNISVLLSHATRKGHDQTLLLAEEGNVYQGGFNPLVQGHWNVILEADDWRVYKSVFK